MGIKISASESEYSRRVKEQIKKKNVCSAAQCKHETLYSITVGAYGSYEL